MQSHSPKQMSTYAYAKERDRNRREKRKEQREKIGITKTERDLHDILKLCTVPQESNTAQIKQILDDIFTRGKKEGIRETITAITKAAKETVLPK